MMNQKKKARVIAFYLPQFHPIPENDKWWGKGFTEWTNVAKAKPLFRGHYQPRIPADLGFYDLRLPETREAQAQLAREAGIEGFCYWHYWFGNGKQLLERPLNEVIATGKPDFPFCLGWANHSWLKKLWNPEVSVFSQDLLIEQAYPGKQDVDEHFYAMLNAFKDKRYMKLDGRLIFLIYDPLGITEFEYFKSRWQELAIENGLPGFYFIAQAKRQSEIFDAKMKLFDAINYDCIYYFFRQSRLRKLWSHITKHPITTPYKKILQIYDKKYLHMPNIIPTIYPSWDLTPRRGSIGTVFTHSTPDLFYQHAKQIVEESVFKVADEKVIFVKSWNEWAEGNYMEPDLKYGRGFIEALHQALHD